MTSSLSRRNVLIGVSALAGTLGITVKNSFAGAPKIHDVKISGFRFAPQHLVVQIGDTIRWTNEDLAPHTATATDGSWDTGELGNGESGSILIAQGLEMSYFCAFHPHMKGMVQLS